MPRAKPFCWRSCGTLYTGFRCPQCYPPTKKKKRRGRSRSGGGGRRSRVTAAQVLGRSMLPVNIDAVPDPPPRDADVPSEEESPLN